MMVSFHVEEQRRVRSSGQDADVRRFTAEEIAKQPMFREIRFHPPLTRASPGRTGRYFGGDRRGRIHVWIRTAAGAA
jgi:hypothetical protein